MDDDTRRKSLDSRLSSILQQPPDAAMRATRRAIPRPLSLPHLQALTAPSMVTAEPSHSKSPTPVIRWLGDHHRRTSASGSNSPTTSAPPSPGIYSLNEALTEDLLPTALPQARLPSLFYASRALSRPPTFLDTLTRSTLPTSSVSVSPGLSLPHDPNTTHSISLDDPPSTSRSTSRSLSASRRTSIDTLRSLRDRGIHTAAPLACPAPTKPTGWWWSNKQSVDTLLQPDDRAPSVSEEQRKLKHKYRSPKNPLVFCHGLLGFDTVSIGPAIAPVQVTHWRGITEVLEANGVEVLITRVPATSSPPERARVLEQRISEAYAGRSVHLIGHSMGGLDCRYLATHLAARAAFTVLSVTTIATPHHGSAFADHFLASLSALSPASLPALLALLALLPNGGGDGEAFAALTRARMRAFNADTPDVPGVRYFSWGARYEPGLIDTWKYSHGVVAREEGANDGLVSVESARWGQYRGTLEDVNHLDLVGWVNPARYKWAELTGREIKFRPATFYLGVADWLAGEVEGIAKEEEGAEGEQGRVGDGVSVSDGVAGEEQGKAAAAVEPETSPKGNT